MPACTTVWTKLSRQTLSKAFPISRRTIAELFESALFMWMIFSTMDSWTVDRCCCSTVLLSSRSNSLLNGGSNVIGAMYTMIDPSHRRRYWSRITDELAHHREEVRTQVVILVWIVAYPTGTHLGWMFFQPAKKTSILQENGWHRFSQEVPVFCWRRGSAGVAGVEVTIYHISRSTGEFLQVFGEQLGEAVADATFTRCVYGVEGNVPLGEWI